MNRYSIFPAWRRVFVLLELLIITVITLLVLTNCATPSILVTKEQNLGDDFFNSHNYPDAILHYNLMTYASKKLGIYRNLSMESGVQRKIADCYSMMGKYDQSLIHVRNAMVLDSADKNLLGTIDDYRYEGRIFIYKGAYQKGIMSLEKSLSLSEGMEQSLKDINRISIADTYLALGQLYSVIGRLDKSLEYTNLSLTIFRQASDRKGEMESYLTLGSVYSDLGDFKTAINFIDLSMKLAIDIDMGTARHNQLLSSVSVALGEYENALRFQEKGLAEAKKIGIAGQVVWATIGLGDIYRELGDLPKAERYYKLARGTKETNSMITESLEASLDMRLGEVLSANQYFSREGSMSGEAISSLRYAEILIQNGKEDSALVFLNQSGRLFEEIKNKQGITNVKLMKGIIMVNKDQYPSAKNLLDSATLSPEFPESVWQAFYHLGRLYEKMNQDDKAIESYLNSVSVIEKIRGNLTIDEFKSIYFDSKREVYDRLINLYLKNNRTVDAFQFSERARARAFYDILANKKIDFRGSVPGDLISMEQEKRIELQKLYKLLQKGDTQDADSEAKRSGEISQVRNSLTKVQTEYEEIVQKIKLSNPPYVEMINAKLFDLPDLQSRLDPKSAAIAYWIRDNELIVWIITHSEILGKRVQIVNTVLNNMVESARKSIQSLAKEETEADLSKLYQVLIAPFETELKPYSNLVVIPNGALHFLPFQALVNGKGEYLVQKYNLVYAPSASVYILCNDKLIKTGSKFMGMALSDISVGNNVGLPGTEAELKRILPLFPDNKSTFGLQSTETFVKKNAGLYNYIHFATHGSYNYRQPLYSSLLFPPTDDDDGRLNVYEVFELNIDARLVTLSACETGLGNISRGDELTGLSRAFLFAGSSTVIVSLWSVADYPTSLLMTNFYRYLKDHPMQEALTLAQRDVIKSYSQPLYWSPFILIGNGNLSAD